VSVLAAADGISCTYAPHGKEVDRRFRFAAAPAPRKRGGEDGLDEPVETSCSDLPGDESPELANYVVDPFA
jgi:hypothetical protein